MKWCPTSRFLAVITAALLVSLFAVSGFAQFQTGNIYGKVQAKDGSVLPGVTVTLTGIGAPQTTVTDAQGNYRFLNLSPGTYTLKADLAGYGTSTRNGVGVRVGSNSDVTLTLNPSVSESIVVTAEAPLLDVRKAGTGANVTKVELEKVPTGRDPWAILTTVPAVQTDRINVGGSQSGQQSVYVAKGASSTDNTWNVDGVNITDMGATGSTPLYFDFDSFEEMQATTGGSDPRIMTPGVQLNMVTKRGTNDFRGSGRYYYTPGSYQADSKIPSDAVSYLANGNHINYVRDYGAELGGPLWRDHLWGWLASSENKISNFGTLRIGAAAIPDNIILRDKNAKLNAQITASNSAVGFYTFGDKGRNARGLSPTRLFPASWHQLGPTKVYKLEDTQIVGSSLYLTGMWSKVSGGFSLLGNGGSGPSAPSFFIQEDGIFNGNFYDYITDRPQKQYRLDGSKFFDLGTMNHELKFGFGYRDTPVTSTTTYPGPAQGYWDFADTPDTCPHLGLPANCGIANLTRDRQAAYGEKYRDYYLGDTILAGNLTLQVGARLDHQSSLNLPSTAAPNPLIGTPITLPCADPTDPNCTGGNFTATLGTLTFGGDTRSLKWNTVSPRVGLTYALGADKKTLLRAAYNRYVSQMGATVNGASPAGYVNYMTFLGADLNHDNVIQRNELLQWYGSAYIADPRNPNTPVSTTRVDYGMTPPKSDEFLLGFERELLTDFSVGATFTYRKYNDIVGYRYEKTPGSGDFYTRADFVQKGTAGGTDPSTGIVTPVVPFYGVAAGVPLPKFAVITNLPGYSQKYDGVELTATKRMSHRWMMRANASWNNWTQNCSAEAFPNPTQYVTGVGTAGCTQGQVVQRSAGSGAFGNVFINSRWNANVTSLYQLPLDFSVGATFTARQGYPDVLRQRFSVASGGAMYNLNGIPGRVEVITGPIGDTRMDNVYELDLRAAKDFRFFNRVGITLSADLFNALNQQTILQRQGRLFFSQSHQITEIQSPRVFRFGARVSF